MTYQPVQLREVYSTKFKVLQLTVVEDFAASAALSTVRWLQILVP